MKWYTVIVFFVPPENGNDCFRKHERSDSKCWVTYTGKLLVINRLAQSYGITLKTHIRRKQEHSAPAVLSKFLF